MIVTYAYTPAIWPPLVTALVLAFLGIYSWRRREVPGARYFAAACAMWSLSTVAIAAEAATVEPAAQVTWHTFQSLWQLPIVTAITCFSLEYVQPGRWLNRRSLALLAVPPVLVAGLILTNAEHYLFWSAIVMDAGVRVLPGVAGWAGLAYALLLTAIQIAAFVWLFVHSPPHRWPVVLMLVAVVATRGLFVLSIIGPNPTAPLDSSLAFTLVSVTTYAIALFGFRFFDPLPAARRAVYEQMSAGVIVFDRQWRAAGLNPAAEIMLGLRRVEAIGKRWQELAPAGPPLPAATATVAGEATALPEITLGGDARQYAGLLSALHDFRGLLMGYLLMLNDVTEQRRAQGQIVEQQRSLAALHEREHLARELHDSIGQVLGYASLQVETAGLLVDAGKYDAATAQLTRLAAVLQDAHADVRAQILDLRTTPSLQRPFFSVVRDYLDGYTSNYHIGTELAIDAALGEATMTPEEQVQLFRILQEALSNTRKHADARRVRVTFAAGNGCLHMYIEDDGRGFAPDAAPDGGNHFGLQFMRERAAEIGGSLAATTAPGGGTRVAVAVPRKEN